MASRNKSDTLRLDTAEEADEREREQKKHDEDTARKWNSLPKASPTFQIEIPAAVARALKKLSEPKKKEGQTPLM